MEAGWHAWKSAQWKLDGVSERERVHRSICSSKKSRFSKKVMGQGKVETLRESPPFEVQVVVTKVDGDGLQMNECDGVRSEIELERLAGVACFSQLRKYLVCVNNAPPDVSLAMANHRVGHNVNWYSVGANMEWNTVPELEILVKPFHMLEWLLCSGTRENFLLLQTESKHGFRS